MDTTKLPTPVAKMKVEIWSDVMCPFCYIGKRNYEKGMEQFAGKGEIETVWKSFQLDPTLPGEAPDKDVYDYLVDRKGISREQVVKMHAHVTRMAEQAGLKYHLDRTVMVNSFKAHRVLQLAKEKGLGDKAEEALFHANFTEGKDFGNTAVLIELGKEIGLTETEVTDALTKAEYAKLVEDDIGEARELGITGVPFFVFDRKYAISGAQPVHLFLETLERLTQDQKLKISNKK